MVFDIKSLDRIIKETLAAIERGKMQLYDIAENTMLEMARVGEELAGVKEDVSDTIYQVDETIIEEKKARIRLVEVSKDFHRYTEEDIKTAYDNAYMLQVELVKLREREKLLRYRRDHLEISLRRLQNTAQRSEKLVSQMGLVFNYLSGGLKDLNIKINELQKTQEMALGIITAQEEERKRVAREIHDGPAQSMANIVMRAEFCLKLLDMHPEKVRDELIALQLLVRSSLTDVRKIIFDLRPMVLDDLGLRPAIKRYLSNYNEQYGLQIEYLFFGQQRRLNSTVEVALFRIIQEMVTNIRKHARAKNAVVKIELLRKKINIYVKDDGIGFDLDTAMTDKDGEGYGLIGMRERIQLLKGEMNIISAPGQGTSISVSVPLDDN
ncbi:MAG: histidine kinase [Desulfotomaculaceae bacterium]|nr:histidine kinase [Desulfotomaculaceae bacterium]